MTDTVSPTLTSTNLQDITLTKWLCQTESVPKKDLTLGIVTVYIDISVFNVGENWYHQCVNMYKSS